ncbi:hypothetical protein GSH19_05045 [Lactobacillus sp. S2-2]|nr:hypothetical protein [Lactobacillus sp. S2-2]MCF6515518.1 hypothetical protein [Lactobacillus sp. S2-2]
MVNINREEKEEYVLSQMKNREESDIKRLSDKGLDGVIRILNINKKGV